MVLWDQAVITERAYPWAPRRQRFTAAEDRAIAWAYRRGWTLARIADQCCRRVGVVQLHVSQLIAAGTLERRPLLPGRRPWTDRDLRFLQVRWGHLPDADVAAGLGRTIEACKIQATRSLHQARGDAFLSASEVGRLLGVHAKTVLRWAEAGYVHVERAAVGAGGRRSRWSDAPRRQWSVTPASLLRLFQERPWLIPPLEGMPAPEHWLVGFARAAWEADPWLTVDQVAAQVHYVPAIVRGWIVREQLVPHRRRPKYGHCGGPHQGAVAIRQSDASLLVARHEQVRFWRQHDAAVARCAALAARRAQTQEAPA